MDEEDGIGKSDEKYSLADNWPTELEVYVHPGEKGEWIIRSEVLK